MSERQRRRELRPHARGGGGGRPRWLAPFSSPPLLLLLLLLLARACDAAAETMFLTHAGVSASAVDLDSPARNAVDGDIAKNMHFAETEKRYPWLAVDLGGLAKVTTVEVFGHKADAACDFHMLKDAGADCDACVVQENHMYGDANEAGGYLRTTTRTQNGRARTTGPSGVDARTDARTRFVEW